MVAGMIGSKCENALVRETEIHSEIARLHECIGMLSDRLDILTQRIACVSNPKPKEADTVTVSGDSVSTVIGRGINEARKKLDGLIQVVNTNIGDLEI